MSPFPFTHQGRQTLAYLVFAGAGPALTALIWWAMRTASTAAQWAIFGRLADTVALALLVVTIALAMFVSIRAIRIGPEGIQAAAGGDGDDTPTASGGAS